MFAKLGFNLLSEKNNHRGTEFTEVKKYWKNYFLCVLCGSAVDFTRHKMKNEL
jgi:hypothetical protein